jgi:hypothetical protein
VGYARFDYAARKSARIRRREILDYNIKRVMQILGIGEMLRVLKA